MSVTDESYNYHENIILNVNGDDYEFRFNGSRCYVISNFIVDVRENENTTVSLRKYTGSEVDKIITTDKYNYMSVEVVG